MATDYTILTPPKGEGPLCTILTGGGDVVAHQVPVKWSERIVNGLKLLDLMERSQGSYVEKIKKELGLND